MSGTTSHTKVNELADEKKIDFLGFLFAGVRVQSLLHQPGELSLNPSRCVRDDVDLQARLM
jgi:hypothetical protein